jgi:antitoxin HicB
VKGEIMNKYTGNNFDDFLEDEGILEEVSAKAHKRLLSLQLADIMQEQSITKTNLAAKLKTSRSQLDRILDPNNTSITIEVLEHVAHAVGKKLQIGFS